MKKESYTGLERVKDYNLMVNCPFKSLLICEWVVFEWQEAQQNVATLFSDDFIKKCIIGIKILDEIDIFINQGCIL